MACASRPRAATADVRDLPDRLRRTAPRARRRGVPVGSSTSDGRQRDLPVPRPDRSHPAADRPPRPRPTRRRRASRSPAAWRATPSRWRTSATGATRPTRPMSGPCRCPGRIGWHRTNPAAVGLAIGRRPGTPWPPMRAGSSASPWAPRSDLPPRSASASTPPKPRRRAACCRDWRELRPHMLVCHFDPRLGHDRRSLEAAVAMATALGAEPWLEAVIGSGRRFRGRDRGTGALVRVARRAVPRGAAVPSRRPEKHAPRPALAPGPAAGRLLSCGPRRLSRASGSAAE